MPSENGFLSVRIKPLGENLERVEAIYAGLRDQEVNHGLSAEDSAVKLVEEIKALGFADYAAFASNALASEIGARNLDLNRPALAGNARFADMQTAAYKLQDETAGLAHAIEAIGTIPTNLRVIATRLEASGGAISVLSQNYWAKSQEISVWFHEFVSNPKSEFATIRNTVDECWLLICTSEILLEAADQFDHEKQASDTVNTTLENLDLRSLARQNSEQAERGLNRIFDEAESISSAITVLRRYISGLSMTRVMCKIESAGFLSGGDSLDDIIEQLGSFQTNINAQLNQIEDLSRSIQSIGQTLISHRIRAARQAAQAPRVRMRQPAAAQLPG